MKIHNLLKNPTDLPSKIEGGLHGESNDVYVLYRVVDNSTHNEWKFVLGVGTGFYSYDENLWYGYYDDHKARVSDFFTESGGQRWDSVENLIDQGCRKEFIQNMTKVPIGFAYDKSIEDGLVFTTEIIGWYELPTYEEFMEE